jgi:hypothetical protein
MLGPAFGQVARHGSPNGGQYDCAAWNAILDIHHCDSLSKCADHDNVVGSSSVGVHQPL